MSYFKGKNVMVTGGASGIGLELCKQLQQAGAKVLLTDIHADSAASTAQQIGCVAAPLDVTDKSGFEACVQQFEADHGVLDMLFNNAGLAITGEAQTFEYNDWKKIIDVNLYGVVNGVHTVYANMVKREKGQIVNIASIAGLYPSAGQASYSASKYAVVGLSHSLRAEAAAHGVKVNVVCPGIIETPMRENLSIKSPNAKAILEQIPKGMNVQKCVRQMLDGVAKDHSTIVITPMAKALWSVNRLHPDLSIWLGSKIIDRFK